MPPGTSLRKRIATWRSMDDDRDALGAVEAHPHRRARPDRRVGQDEDAARRRVDDRRVVALAPDEELAGGLRPLPQVLASLEFGREVAHGSTP